MTTKILNRQVRTKTFNVTLGGAGKYLAFPEGFLTKDGGNIFMGAGIVTSIRLSTALPASSIFQIVDAINPTTKVPISGGSAVADADLTSGQFPITGPGVLDLAGSSSDGVLNLIDTPSGIDAFVVGDPTALGSAPWALGAGTNGQVKAEIPTGPNLWEGFVECAAGLMVRISTGAAWTGSITIDYYLIESGAVRYSKWRRKGRHFRSGTITGVATGASTDLTTNISTQIVPVGATYDVRISGSGVQGIDGLWKGLTATALSGGFLHVILPLTTTGVISPAGTVSVIWPTSVAGGPLY